MTFAHPQYLYLLILIPALLGLFVLARMARQRKLRRFGRPDVLEHLMPDASPYKPWIKISLELLALLFIIIALARPQSAVNMDSSEEETTSRGIEIMLCVDVSNSMLASATDDPSGVSRLQRAKFILEKLVDKMSDDKVGLIVFAGDAYTQLPITTDYISAKMFLGDLSTDIVPTQGTAIGAAIEMAESSFTPESDFQKAIVIITDGENFEDDAVEAAADAARQGIQVDVVGIGSGKGAPIPVKGSSGQFMTDQNGEQIVTRLDEDNARAIAKAGDGVYVNGASTSAVNDLDEQLDKLSKTEYKRTSVPMAAEQFPLAVWVAFALIVIDIFILDRKISWLKRINFFTKS